MEQNYPSIAEILNRSGQELKLGGIVAEKRTEFVSSETTNYNWTYEIGDEKLRRLYGRARPPNGTPPPTWIGALTLTWRRNCSPLTPFWPRNPGFAS